MQKLDFRFENSHSGKSGALCYVTFSNHVQRATETKQTLQIICTISMLDYFWCEKEREGLIFTR
jgi:hypothetical protein